MNLKYMVIIIAAAVAIITVSAYPGQQDNLIVNNGGESSVSVFDKLVFIGEIGHGTASFYIEPGHEYTVQNNENYNSPLGGVMPKDEVIRMDVV